MAAELRKRKGPKPEGSETTAAGKITVDQKGLKPEDSETSGAEKPIDPAKIAAEESFELHHGGTMEKKKKEKKTMSCYDRCAWLVGNFFIIWYAAVLFLKVIPQKQVEFVKESIMGPTPDPPGVKAAKEGLRMKHPVVFVPGIVTGSLELWEGNACMDGLFRKRLWGGTFGDVYKRPFCWMDHMVLDNETGLDPPGVRVRPVSGLVAADYFMPGYFVWAVMIKELARIGYDERSMFMASYDWRLSFLNNEVRDRSLSRLKSTIEMLKASNNGEKVVVIPHSMGALYYYFFTKWVEAPAPLGGGGGPTWVADHVHAVANIGGPMLGVPKAFTGIFSAEAKDVAVARAIAPGMLEGEGAGGQTLQHVLRVTRTWDSTMSMLPKGGEAVWGGLDWSPEEGYICKWKKEGRGESVAEGNSKKDSGPPPKAAGAGEVAEGESGKVLGEHGKPLAHYGRMISFGREALQMPAQDLPQNVELNAKEGVGSRVRTSNSSCGDVWTEYHELAPEVAEAVEARGVYTVGDLEDLLKAVAPRYMQRADAIWSHGIADDPSLPKYQHPKYWSNPLESSLPLAPEMQVFCLYGVGILTERSYVYKRVPSNDSCFIPFHIDPSVERDSEGCLKGGVHFVDGDETIPVLSLGLMCARGWRNKTRFNPSGARVYTREYAHAPPASLLEGRGTQSGSHVDIMGNFALIEDILRIAAGSSGDELGGDRIYSDLLKWADRVKL